MSSVMLATLYNIAPQLQVKFWCYNFMQCEIPDYLPNADPGAGRAGDTHSGSIKGELPRPQLSLTEFKRHQNKFF